jgi:hypothetical protein
LTWQRRIERKKRRTRKESTKYSAIRDLDRFKESFRATGTGLTGYVIVTMDLDRLAAHSHVAANITIHEYLHFFSGSWYSSMWTAVVYTDM